MTAEEILAKRPSQLFPGGPAEIKRRFGELVKVWHPDHCRLPQSEKVFQHILRSRDAALRGEEGLHRAVFTRRRPQARQSGQFALDYASSTDFEAGVIYVSYENVSYLVAKDHEHLCPPALNMRWSFPDRKMEEEMTKYLPRRNRWEEVEQGTLLVYRRNTDQILLSDLLRWEREKNGGRVDPRHVMWMISSLLNTCCYLEIQKTAHCALLPHYLLVSPDMHSVALTGPPMYATPYGTRPKAVPQRVLDLFPRLKTKGVVVENSRLDLTLVRALALETLGLTTAGLPRATDLHEGLRKWLASPAPDSAVKDYVAWEEARGKRAFTPYGITANEMYVALAA